MGEAKRRKEKDSTYGKVRRQTPSGARGLATQVIPSSTGSVILLNTDPGAEQYETLTTTVQVQSIGELKVSLGQLFWLSESPHVKQIAQASQGQLIADRWYSPVVIEDVQGNSAQGIVFFAPPYNNVKIGIGWISSSWDKSMLLALDAAVRSAINPLSRVRFMHADPEIKSAVSQAQEYNADDRASVSDAY